jgi:hypothetical protein
MGTDIVDILQALAGLIMAASGLIMAAFWFSTRKPIADLLNRLKRIKGKHLEIELHSRLPRKTADKNPVLSQNVHREIPREEA